MIKLTARFLIVYIILAATVLYFSSGIPAAYSCLAGGGLMLLDLGGFYFAWQLYFRKKSVALMVLVIIFKYFVLALVFWSLTKVSWMDPLGMVLGISTLVLAILSMTLAKSFARKL